MYIRSRYYHGGGTCIPIMEMSKFNSLYRAIKVEVSAIPYYSGGKDPR